jgi:hypothetical protein
MADWSQVFGVSKAEPLLMVLFIPSVDRQMHAIDQPTWVDNALEVLGTHCGGATAFPQGRGVWRDDQQAGKLIYDNPVVIHCYTHGEILEQNARPIKEFLLRMGTATNQGAVGYVIDGKYFEIQFPLREGDRGQGQ